MSTYPWKEPLAKHFSQDIPLQRRFGCKDSEFLGDMQIKITLEVIFIVEGVKSMV